MPSSQNTGRADPEDAKAAISQNSKRDNDVEGDDAR